MTTDQRAVFNAAFRIGVALDRKFEVSDLTPELRQAARLYAASYDGDFDFMISMRDNATAGSLFFSDNQSKSILNCLMADAKRRMAAKKPATSQQASAPAVKVLANVPDGRYRVTLVDGQHLAIKVTLAGRESKLAGSRVVSTRINGDEWMGVAHIAPDGAFRLWRSCHGDLRSRVENAVEILDQAEGQDGWLVAGLAFAQEGSQCFICGRDLDTPESLTAGYGPVCAEKHGLPWGAKAIPMSVRLAQAAAAQAAPASEPTPTAPAAPLTDEEDDAAWEATRNALRAAKKEATPAWSSPVSITDARTRGLARRYTEIFGDD